MLFHARHFEYLFNLSITIITTNQNFTFIVKNVEGYNFSIVTDFHFTTLIIL